MTSKVFVGKLSRATTTAALRQTFEEFGEISECKVVQDAVTRISKSFGYVTFRQASDAEAAIAKLHGSELDGQKITVEFARDQQPRASHPFHHFRRAIDLPEPVRGPITYEELPSDKANEITFFQLCERFDQISQARGAAAKLALLFDEKLVRHLRNQSWYPILRLIMPDLDSERTRYNLGARAMGKVIVKAIGLQGQKQNDSVDRILNWRDGTKAQGGSGGAVGDFPLVLRDVLEKRGYTSSATRLTVGEINAELDRLHDATTAEEREKVLAKLINSCTALEIFWFTRIILKDMKCGLHYPAILRRYHPDGEAAIDSHGDLRRCLAELRDPNVRHEYQVELFSSSAPMLAKIVRMDEATNGMGDFIIEPKYDGDRMLVHVDKTVFPPKIKFFTRNGNDYTERYGSPILFSQILQAVQCERCILDGEMLAWSDETESVMGFGNTTAVALEMNHAEYDGKRWLYYVCFDALLVQDGKGGNPVLTKEPLRTRRARLKSILNPIERRVELVPQLAIVTQTDLDERHAIVMDELDKIILGKGEGLILKALASPYCGGESGRKAGHWVKVKPEHVHGLAEDVDAVILGGYYAEGKRRANANGDPSVFLVGIPAPSSPDSPHPFLVLAKVGSGYSDLELESLRLRLRPYRQVLGNGGDRLNLPPHFALPAKRADWPDVWYMAENSVVLQITGSELVRSETFSATYTLRFPRMTRIRNDKSYKDCTTFEEIQRFATEFKSGLGLYGAKRAADVARLDAHNKRMVGGVAKRKRPQAQVLGVAGTEHLEGLEQTGHAFDGCKFYVFPGTTCAAAAGGGGPGSKEELEAFIALNGGSVVQVPSGKQDVYLVASAEVMKRPSRQLENIRHCGTADVLRADFIVSCANAQSVDGAQKRLSEPSFGDFLIMSKATSSALGNVLDEFGDHFEQDADAFSLERCMREMVIPRGGNSSSITSNDEQVLQSLLDDADDPLATPSNNMRGIVAWFPQRDLDDDLEALVLRMRGGRVVNELSARVTHVFFPAPLQVEAIRDCKKRWQADFSGQREPFWLDTSFILACSRAQPALPWEHFPTFDFECAML